MEEFDPEDAWAITKMVQLSNTPRKKRQQIDTSTKHRMLTQWDWWRTNYIDEKADRSRHMPLGPTRKLLEVIDQDMLIKRISEEELHAASIRAEHHIVLNRFQHENRRAHQLALTNAATSNRMLQSTTSNSFLGTEMNHMAAGAVLSRASVGKFRETLRSTISALSVLDFVPEHLQIQPIPRSPAPYFEKQLPARTKRREVKMLYLERYPTSGSIGFDVKSKSDSAPSTALSDYTPDLESTSTKSFPMTVEALQVYFPVIEAKCNSTLWRNPAITTPIELPKF